MTVLEEREQLVKVVEDEKAPFLFFFGEGFLWEPLPKGTRVIYGPPPLTPIDNLEAAIDSALEHPLNADPLSAQLRRGMRVTIVFDDLSLPLPPMQQPDIRQLIIEQVLQKCAEKGIDDIHLIAAIGLHRRMTPDELRHQVGEKVFKAFYPLRLYNHDGEDPNGVVFLGKTEQGEEVWLNRRVAESDLVIYVNVNLTPMDGGHKSLVTGVTNYATVRYHHNAHMLLTSYYMDPPRSPFHGVLLRQGRLIEQHIRHFQIETVINSNTFPLAFAMLQRYERSWQWWERAWFHLLRFGCAASPFELNRRIWHSIKAPYGVIGIHAGEVESVHDQTLKKLAEQQEVPVKGQSDIVLCGTPYLGPYNVNSIMNPILVYCLTTGYLFHLMSIGKPLLREGGVLIFTHPLYERFHEQHHPSYVDFWRTVMPQTRDPREMEKFEPTFAFNERYRYLYRHDYAYHGVHPFYMWYWGSLGHAYAGKVIFVKGNKKVAERLGVETAPTVRDAVEMAKSFLGKSDPSISYFHLPPIFTCRVE